MNERDLRDCFGTFATGVMIASTSFEGKLYGMTINSFASVSLDPALLLFSIDNDSANLPAFKQAKHFSLSTLSAAQLTLAQEFAKPANDKKWQVGSYSLSEKQVPIFQNSLSYFECERHQIVEAGDHHILIGRIIDAKKMQQDKPLMYLNGAFIF